MEAIIVTIVVAAVLVLFAVMAIGPLVIEMRTPARTTGTIVRMPHQQVRQQPQGPAGGQQAAWHGIRLTGPISGR